MAVDTEKSIFLAEHLDKIAYGVAIVLGLVVLLVPMFSTRGLKAAIGRVAALQEQCRDRLGEPIPGETVPDVESILDHQWSVSPCRDTGWITPWTVEVRPAVVKIVAELEPHVATHEAGRITKITYLRSKENSRPYLRVEAIGGSTDRARIKRTTLLRREVGDGGDFKEIATLTGHPLVHDDMGVETNRRYAYKLVTVAEVDGDRGRITLGDGEKIKKSAPLEMIQPIPFEFAVKIRYAFDYDTTDGTEPIMNAEVRFWDYAAGKMGQVDRLDWAEKATFGPRDAEKGVRFLIKQIGNNKVEIVDRWDRRLFRELLTPRDNKRLVDLPPTVVPHEGREPENPPPTRRG